MTLREALLETSNRIARRDAETLAQHLLARDRAWLLAHLDDPLDDAALLQLRNLTARREARHPLQHLTGVQEFFGLPLRVTPDVLIPRPETELLVEAVLDWLKGWHWRHHPHILDVGTGSGAIALALAANRTWTRITAVDISPAALAVARSNAEMLGYAETGARHIQERPEIRFVQADLLPERKPSLAPTRIEGHYKEVWPHYDIIVSNPPYVPIGDAATMQPEVVAFEPHAALFAGDDGLEVYRRLIPAAHAVLRREGLLAMEFGFGQREPLRSLFQSQPAHSNGTEAWRNLRFLDDYAGIPRIVLAERA